MSPSGMLWQLLAQQLALTTEAAFSSAKILQFDLNSHFSLRVGRARYTLPWHWQDHALLIEQGRVGRPAVPGQLCGCTFCTTQAVGNEQYSLCDCPQFGHLESEDGELSDEAHGAMRSLMRHNKQKTSCAVILAIVKEAQTLRQICPHRPFAGCTDIVNFLLLLLIVVWSLRPRT